MKRTLVNTGLDILVEEGFKRFKGRRGGLIANQASVTSSLQYSFEVLQKTKNMWLSVIFSPEHGIYGTAQDMVPVQNDTFTYDKRKRTRGVRSIPVRSLYGRNERSLRPKENDLSSIDCLIFDLQDVGSRYYTFIATMCYCMEACARNGKKMIILDRPNPINGKAVEGPIVAKGYSSFVGCLPIPVRHGMTCGELSTYFNDMHSIGCALDVVKMRRWEREMWFDDTALPWIPPSPNMPSLDTATVYPGTCLLEGTNISEGRGTTKPFQYIGAPWIEPYHFAEKLNSEKLPGVVFRPVFFTPTFHKWKGEMCGGVHLYVKDRESFQPFMSGVAIVRAALTLHPGKFRWRKEPYEFVKDRLAFDLLAGSDRLRRQLLDGSSLGEISASWKEELEEFKKIRKKYLLY